jgi:capsular polysaccharide biosynthesis protein
MEKYFNNTNLINILLKWRIHLLVILSVAVVLAVIFSSSFFITPKFKSMAVIYPANVSPYSEESETEQMYQILQSQDITDSIIKKFNLPEHYKISTSYKYFKTAIYYEYSQNVKIEKTPYDAVGIEVLDKDPEMACNIVNAIIDFYNKKVRGMHNDKYLEVMDMYHQLLSKKERDIDSLKQALYSLSVESGLLGYDQSSEEIMRGYLRTVTTGAAGNINTPEVKRLKENMEKVGGDLILLTESIKNEARGYAAFKVQYEDALRFYDAKLTYCNVITHPFASDKKSYPVRWLIVAMTFILTFFFSIVVILMVENLRIAKIRKNQNQLNL